ncbi:M23 family metallopeptidase [Simiduia sp. 21SJ11W-1]|uniref:M23 family metallopeptidase n=1 Tax=Simiduia sp. 21SJ11W-1 TaxID=2909669 RepID=UPI00209DFEF3|nr:M23 family metallopeptidase [Simiduia sp. 21SJ11W-1]UTA48876.1 M23 family metallopeptidase [Simiduia sp. 21SJ11W-1]
MKVILVSQRHGSTRSFTLGGWTRAVLSACLIGLPAGVGVVAGLEWAKGDGADLFTPDTAKTWNQDLADQRVQVEETRRHAQQQLAAITLRMAELQARLVRLDALGERLTTIAKLDEGEFDFSQAPALGGPESASLGDAFTAPEFLDAIDQLTDQIENREQQLEILEALLAKRKIQNDVFLAGRPVTKGWMSSRYGRRTDPFTGRVAWHSGVDFAGKMGSDVISVAAGVVTWAGKRHGYGDLVEINHGNGFSTRYAHNSEVKVKVGDIVKKGQVIALMGTSGRSTGPHVHFEVYKHGRPVDPAAYIHRAAR